jgi:hypothetical protein
VRNFKPRPIGLRNQAVPLAAKVVQSLIPNAASLIKLSLPGCEGNAISAAHTNSSVLSCLVRISRAIGLKVALDQVRLCFLEMVWQKKPIGES